MPGCSLLSLRSVVAVAVHLGRLISGAPPVIPGARETASGRTFLGAPGGLEIVSVGLQLGTRRGLPFSFLVLLLAFQPILKTSGIWEGSAVLMA